jgi:hypothetical protein
VKGILPSEEAEDQRTDGGKNTDTPKMPSLEQFKHLPSIHDAQRMAFQYTFKQCGDLFKTDRLHSLNAIVNEFCKRETTQSGDTDPIPHMMSALHIEDYGFGDPEQQFMTLLKDNLLELILLTHINVRYDEYYVVIPSGLMDCDLRILVGVLIIFNERISFHVGRQQARHVEKGYQTTQKTKQRRVRRI